MSITLHTTLGDIKVELFCDKCPKSCENFLALCASDYYKDNVFTRNVRGFMVQTGDPSNTGKGGESIWGAAFEDELHSDLKHDARGVLSMANNGPNKNRSQFFITYDAHPHLDLKYTIFGKIKKLTPNIGQLLSNVSEMSRFMRTLLLKSNYFTRSTSFVISPKFFRLYTSSTPTSSESSLENDQQKKIRQMQEYFSQYIEEYYEEEDSLPEVKVVSAKVLEERINLSTLDDVLTLLEREKAQDIKAIDLTQIASSPYQHMVICSPFNPRHGKALTEKIRQNIKATSNLEPSMNRHQMDGSSRSGWYCVEVSSIQIHVMTPSVRERFDLESLWDEKPKENREKSWTDDAIPPPSSTPRV
ncbi:unnamed protein product, partial [Mesorhabditis belari]|uniref:PPIase cyclophilin-type domain-containing protein n=1 Tax=Mesorhabditis belari TaxID=2138241 RepID=A0AAF3EFK4_9BILA